MKVFPLSTGMPNPGLAGGDGQPLPYRLGKSSRQTGSEVTRSAFTGTSKRLEAAARRMFNPTVEVSQSGRPEQQADFDGLGSKENSPGMSGTNLSRLESSVPLKSCP